MSKIRLLWNNLPIYFLLTIERVFVIIYIIQATQKSVTYIEVRAYGLQKTYNQFT